MSMESHAALVFGPPVGYSYSIFFPGQAQTGQWRGEVLALAHRVAKRCKYPESRVEPLVDLLTIHYFTQGNFTTCVLELASQASPSSTYEHNVVAAGSAKRTPLHYRRINGKKVLVGDEDSWQTGYNIALAKALKVLFYRENMRAVGHLA